MTPHPLPELSPAQALWRGVVTTLVVALPVGVMNQVLVDSGDVEAGSPVTLVFVVLILFGGAAGGWAVLRLSPAARLAHAAAASAIAYVLVQGGGILKRLIWGPDEFSWFAYAFLTILMATCGMLGGMFARRWHRGYGASPEEGPNGGGTG